MITDSEYRKMLEDIVASGMTEIERGDILIRSMCKAIDYILNYRYVKEHYHGSSPQFIEDQVNRVTDAIVVVISDIDLYLVALQTIDNVDDQTGKRVRRLWTKLDDK